MNEKLYLKILNQDSNLKKDTIWFTAGSLCNSLSSIVLSLLTTRILGTHDAGIFAIGWAISQLMLTIGWYSTRQYQISDVNERFTFGDYLSFKFITITIMVIGSIIYSILLKQDNYKMFVALSLTGLMITETFADVFSGFFQQKNKLFIAGKSYVVRIITYDIIFFFILMLTKNIIFATIAAMCFSLLWLYCFDYQIAKKINVKPLKVNFTKSIQLAIICFPLFAGSFLSAYIINVPKNAIELYLNSEIQTYYNIIFMPSSVINLFGMFIFVPLFSDLAKTWNNHFYEEFIKIIKRIILYIFSLIIIILIGAFFLGIPILSIIYNVNLDSYKLALMILLLAGGINSIVYVTSFVITLLRKQMFILLIYGFASFVTLIITKYFVINYGIIGAALVYFIANICIASAFIFICYLFISRELKQNKL